MIHNDIKKQKKPDFKDNLILKLFLFVITFYFVLLGFEKGRDQKKPDDKRINSCLLTDKKLVVPIDKNAPKVKAEWAEWISRNHHPVRSLTCDDYSDLQFLKPLLKDKEIVQLGENGHCVKEFNLLKVRLIKFLHKEMDFDIIAFESSFFSCFDTYEKINKFNAYEMMRQSIFPIWHTTEVRDLFEYINKKNNSENPLILAGFDVQLTGRGIYNRPSFLREIISAVDKEYSQKVWELDREYMNKVRSSRSGFDLYLKKNKEQLFKKYNEVLEFINTNMEKLKKTYPDLKKVLVAKQTVISIIEQIKLIIARGVGVDEYYDVRDRAMANNVDYLLKKLYPGKKIIVWAHNGHVRYKNDEVDGWNPHMMGTWLKKKYEPIVYTIGLYMYSGNATWTTRKVFTIPTPEENSLEAIFSKVRLRHFFVDMLNETSNNGNSWMFQKIPAIDYDDIDLKNVKLVPRDQYDAILFIREVNIPNFLLWKRESGYILKRIDAAEFIGKKFKIKAAVKMNVKGEKNRGVLWVRVDLKNKGIGFFNNMYDRPIRYNQWKEYEIIGEVAKNADKISFGAIFFGKGQMYLDEFQFCYVDNNGEWISKDLKSLSFEEQTTGQEPKEWKFSSSEYIFKIVEKDPFKGKKCLLIQNKG